MKDLISVVIPVYNVEKYVEECIISVINQTYTNIEIILVDDGSKDSSGKICDLYSKKDSRIKVIHKENGGLSDARNAGIDEARGKYITFIDSDDYVDEKYIEVLYESLTSSNAQMSQCGIKKFYENGTTEDIYYSSDCVKSSKEFLLDTYNAHWDNVVVWNKMYLLDSFKNIKFPKGKIHEDEYTTYKIVYDLNRISITSQILYHYRQTLNSITGKKYNIKRLDILEALEERADFFKEKNEQQLYTLTLIFYLAVIKKHYILVKQYIENSKKIQKKMLKKYRNVHNKLKMNLKEKIKSLFFYIFPNVYYIIKKGDK